MHANLASSLIKMASYTTGLADAHGLSFIALSVDFVIADHNHYSHSSGTRSNPEYLTKPL